MPSARRIPSSRPRPASTCKAPTCAIPRAPPGVRMPHPLRRAMDKLQDAAQQFTAGLNGRRQEQSHLWHLCFDLIHRVYIYQRKAEVWNQKLALF